MPARAAARPRRRPTVAPIVVTADTRVLLEQCAGAAGTTADEHVTTLILRDAHRLGLLPGATDTAPERTPPASGRPSVIAPFSPEWERELLTYPPAGLC